MQRIWGLDFSLGEFPPFSSNIETSRTSYSSICVTPVLFSIVISRDSSDKILYSKHNDLVAEPLASLCASSFQMSVVVSRVLQLFLMTQKAFDTCREMLLISACTALTWLFLHYVMLHSLKLCSHKNRTHCR